MSGHWTQIGFVVIVCLVVLQRLLDVGLSRRREQALRSRGIDIPPPGRLGWTLLLNWTWPSAMLIESLLLQRPFYALLAMPALVAVVAGQSIRLMTMFELRHQWTSRTVAAFGEQRVACQIYSYLRRARHVASALEIAALPLVHTAWITALVYSTANVIGLSAHLRGERLATGGKSAQL